MNFVRNGMNVNALKLFICGALALFCELFLIRWFNSCVPFVKFYSNFILMSSFLGIGIGALCVRFNYKFNQHIFLFLFITVCLGPVLSYTLKCDIPPKLLNPDNGNYLLSELTFFNVKMGANIIICISLIGIYLINAFLFIIFGQWIGILFKNYKPLIAYTIEIGGSIFGILAYSIVSELIPHPVISVVIIFLLSYIILEKNKNINIQFFILSALTFFCVFLYCKNFIWSSQNKIAVSEISKIGTFNNEQNDFLLNVNNNYNYFILNQKFKENARYRKLAEFYDFPYKNEFYSNCGSLLIIGAGGGNEIAAALNNNCKEIDVVESDEVLIDISRKFQSYDFLLNKTVNIYLSDIRSFVKNTNKKYSKIIFSFYDDESLLSHYSSIRLENFIFTYESMCELKNIIEEEGKIFISLSKNCNFQKERLIKLLNMVFKNDTKIFENDCYPYFKSLTFMNGNYNHFLSDNQKINISYADITTDDRPFWYLDNLNFHKHYAIYMVLIILAGFLCLLFLPKGERKIQFTYFFLGAGFFLIETSNVTNLSLLFGSNSMVNITVFIWVLGLILLGNFTCFILKRIAIYRIFGFLIISLLISYFVPTSIFLLIKIKWVQSVIAGFIFLCPIYFASLIFANMIQREKHLYQAYGSNILGAVVGGAFEYFSLIFGIKFLLVITAVFYALAALSFRPKH